MTQILMHYLALPLLATSLTAIFDIMRDGLKAWQNYYYLFAAVLIAKLLLFCPLQAGPVDYSESRNWGISAGKSYQWEISPPYYEGGAYVVNSWPSLANSYLKQYNQHMKNYENACMFLPTKSDQALADNLLVIGASMIAASDPRSRMLNAACVFISEYALGVAEEWREIRRHLYKAEQALEMYEFYANLIEKEKQECAHQ